MSPTKPPSVKIPVPPIPVIPEDDDFDVEDDTLDPDADVTDEDDQDDDDQSSDLDDYDEDEVDEEGNEDDDRDDRDHDKKKRDEKEDKKKDESEEKKEESESDNKSSEDEPGKQRSEDPTKKANEDPRVKPEEPTAGKATGPEGAAGEGAGSAAEGAASTAEGASSAAGTAASAAEATAAATEATAAATEAAAAAAPAAVEAGAVAVGTAPEWVPIVAIIALVIVAIVIVFSLGRMLWRRIGHSGDLTGSRANNPANVADTNIREEIAQLAVAAGDGTIRQQLTKEKLADVFTRLNAAAEAATSHPSKNYLTEHIAAAKTAAGVLVESTGSRSGDEYTKQLKQFQYHMNAIAAGLMGIGKDTPTSLIARASDAFSGTWVRTANDRDKNSPLRDGSNVVRVSGHDTRGCDPAGFITYIMRNPQIPCTDCVAPNVVELPKVYSPALTAVDMSGGFKTELLHDGDIVLTKLATAVESGEKTDYGAFIYLGDASKELAYCGTNGPAKLSRDALLDKHRTVTTLLRLRATP